MSKEELFNELELQDEAQEDNLQSWAELHGAYQDEEGNWIV